MDVSIKGPGRQMWVSAKNNTWEVSLSTQREAVFGPLHHPTISHDDTGQGD